MDRDALTLDTARRVQRRALELSLRGARLPVTVLEAVAGRNRDTATWLPVMLADRTAAGVKRLVGQITHDDVLLGAANLEDAAIAEREEAALQRKEAAEVRAQAEQTAKARQADLEAERELADEMAEAAEAAVDEAADEARQDVIEKAEAKRRQSRQRARQRKDAIEGAVSQQEAAALRRRSKALDAEEEALDATKETVELDRQVKTRKARRRAG